MEVSVATARSALRRFGGRFARRLAQRNGFELVRAGRVVEDPATVAIPRERTQTFATEEYQVVPKGLFDVVPRNYYSPIPNLELLPDDIWERRSALGGVDLRTDSAIELIEGELAPFIAELNVPNTGPVPAGTFYLHNEN
jgi:hypothetical protein